MNIGMGAGGAFKTRDWRYLYWCRQPARRKKSQSPRVSSPSVVTIHTTLVVCFVPKNFDYYFIVVRRLCAVFLLVWDHCFSYVLLLLHSLVFSFALFFSSNILLSGSVSVLVFFYPGHVKLADNNDHHIRAPRESVDVWQSHKSTVAVLEIGLYLARVRGHLHRTSINIATNS